MIQNGLNKPKKNWQSKNPLNGKGSYGKCVLFVQARGNVQPFD